MIPKRTVINHLELTHMTFKPTCASKHKRLIYKLIVIFTLYSVLKDSEEMSNFISVFVEEYRQVPHDNLFESCHEITKRYFCF